MASMSRELAGLLLVCLLGVFAPTAYGQVHTASISGIITDPTGALIPGASIALTNIATGVERTTVSNQSGLYSLREIAPGDYTLTAANPGFETTRVEQFNLAVNQASTLDLSLGLSEVQVEVTVEAIGTAIQSSTAELGGVLDRQEIDELPLQGRNFTQLLVLTPGASPVNVSQNAGSHFSAATQASIVVIPAVNGQTNRSNLFYLDGINNQSTFASAYAVPPILDTIQEFKVQTHNDTVEFGGAVGGIVNVYTKSGTNEYHGSLWEFLRNDVMNARNTFQEDVTPFRYNMFGAAGGGPIVKDKLFFYGGFQGFRFSTPAESFYRVPTAANLTGDLSDWRNSDGSLRPIYDPFTTVEVGQTGTFSRDAFPNNQIPAGRLHPGFLTFLRHLPAPVPTGVGDTNAVDRTPREQDQNEYQVKVDYQIGQNDSFWFRWSQLTNDTTSSSSRPQLQNISSRPAKNIGTSWVHVFSPSTMMQWQFGRIQGAWNTTTRYLDGVLPAGLAQTIGFDPAFTSNFISGDSHFPNLGVSGYFGGGESNNFSPDVWNTWEFKGSASHVSGNHTYQWGGGYTTLNFKQQVESDTVGFSPLQTDNPLDIGSGGSGLASMLLNVNNDAFFRDSFAKTRPGGVLSFFVQDSWKATPKLHFNIGLRYDRLYIPPFGTFDRIGKRGSPEMGLPDFDRGIYILQFRPPSCEVRGFVPCIAGDTLPENVVTDPRGKLYHDSTRDFQPRLGIAYRMSPRTVIRTGFSLVYDEGAGAAQQSQNGQSSWPDRGLASLFNQNVPTTDNPRPTVLGTDPFEGKLQQLPLVNSPFEPGGYTGNADPFFKTMYSMQWNFGIQHELTPGTLLTANYVGSGNRRTRATWRIGNASLVPGPGPPLERAPFNYMPVGFYMRSVGKANYNAFQFTLNREFSDGITFVANYTYSKSIDIGCSGYENPEGCHIQRPYDFESTRSVSAYDLTHIFTGHWLYEFPFGTGKSWRTGNRVTDYIIGNWQVNGIVVLQSGQPYHTSEPSDRANIGSSGYLLTNLVGNPVLANPTRQAWFNTAAYKIPDVFTFGNNGTYNQRQDWFRSIDLSLFREFPISEGKKFQLRAEAFNAFNNVVFARPDTNVSSVNFGRVFGTALRPRVVQLGLKFIF